MNNKLKEQPSRTRQVREKQTNPEAKAEDKYLIKSFFKECQELRFEGWQYQLLKSLIPLKKRCDA